MTDTKRRLLTDEVVRKLRPAAPRTRYDVWDTLVPNMSVRVTERGAKSLVLRVKVPGEGGRARRALGTWPTLTVEQARARARRFLAHVAEGHDPKQAERRAEGAATTFGEAAEQWLALRVRDKQRKARDVEREVAAYLLPSWGALPVSSITRADVKQLVAGIRDGGLKGKPAPYQAHNVLGHIRSFYRWAVHEERFGLEANPAREVEPTLLIGEKKPRQRMLSDPELRAFWRATAKMAYPYGPLLRLLLLTGARNTEVRDARWCEFGGPEFDTDAAALAKAAGADDSIALSGKALWVVPQERVKQGSIHLVPLSDAAVELLRGLPRFQWGDHLFTATFGRTPVYGLSKAKAKLDELMLAELRVADSKAELRPFVVHDLRRTVRARLSSIGIADEVAELVIGHARTGIRGVYDRFHYEPQMRVALESWAAHLRTIVDPPPPGRSKVPVLAEERAKRRKRA